MITRAGKGSWPSFAEVLATTAVVLAWQLLVSCAEGGGQVTIGQDADDASVVPDTGSPTPKESCGDGVVNVEGEQCDGNDLDGMTCADLGEGTGQLACNEAKCIFDTSMCVPDTVNAGTGGYGGGNAGNAGGSSDSAGSSGDSAGSSGASAGRT